MNALEVETTDEKKLQEAFDHAIWHADTALEAVTNLIKFGEDGGNWSKATMLRNEVIKELIALHKAE